MTIKDIHNKTHYNFFNYSRFLKTQLKYKYCLSYDTETYNGKCKLLARNTGHYILEPTFLECLDFLFYKSSESNGYRFFFNIDFDVSAILKIWNDLDAIKLLKDGISVKYNDYKM